MDFLRSRDGGKTWGEPIPIEAKGKAAPNNNETTVLCLDGRRLLAAARTTGDQHVELYASDDFGETWEERGAVTMPWQLPGHLLKLEDGRILLTFGIRCKGYFGVGARISKHGGNHWGASIFLVDYQAVADGGYPSSVQLEDGTIVTAYYNHKAPHHHRYHMGVVRWKGD
ncbi:sialidase family protein [Paenibacillus sp. GCM10027626]|uniref:sialidase family protein n=1 Tax=Paenibacillus sp. GCM10027626 TaxID=3273411 RepID=UPI003635E7C4